MSKFQRAIAGLVVCCFCMVILFWNFFSKFGFIPTGNYITLEEAERRVNEYSLDQERRKNEVEVEISLLQNQFDIGTSIPFQMKIINRANYEITILKPDGRTSQ